MTKTDQMWIKKKTFPIIGGRFTEFGRMACIKIIVKGLALFV